MEKLIKQIMAECEADGEPITYAEAKEMAEMEIKSKGLRRYEKSNEPKEKKKKQAKLDEQKVDLIKVIYELLGGECRPSGMENLQIANQQREITFTIGNDNFSLILTKHRGK